MAYGLWLMAYGLWLIIILFFVEGVSGFEMGLGYHLGV
jgi:hypothetical protein